MGIFGEKFRKNQKEQLRFDITNSGDFLVAKATVQYAATVFKDTVDRKVNKLTANTALSLKAPDLMGMYQEMGRVARELIKLAKECSETELSIRYQDTTDDEVLELDETIDTFDGFIDDDE